AVPNVKPPTTLLAPPLAVTAGATDGASGLAAPQHAQAVLLFALDTLQLPHFQLPDSWPPSEVGATDHFTFDHPVADAEPLASPPFDSVSSWPSSSSSSDPLPSSSLSLWNIQRTYQSTNAGSVRRPDASSATRARSCSPCSSSL